MNKADIAVHVRERCPELTKAQAVAVTDAVVDAIGKGLLLGGDVRLTDLGTFRTVTKASRIGRNPKTGEKLTIPASRKIKFKAGRALLAALNEEAVC
jgi:DNA-binding protein HU-beta